jgi:ribosomal protein S18 acetylase RimI-like enzyme
VRIRDATTADLPALERLCLAFGEEVPEPPYVDVDMDRELREVEDMVVHEIAVVAENEHAKLVGFALARRAGLRLGRITDLYVDPAARGTGLATQLVRGAAVRLRALGLDMVRLEVVAGNTHAREIYERWGFREDELTLVASLDELTARLAEPS